MKIYQSGMVLIFFLFCLAFCAPEPEVGPTSVSFICLDQFGNRLENMELSFRGKKSNSDAQGRCVFPLNPGSATEVLDTVAVADNSPENDNHIFLGPQVFQIGKNQNPVYALYFMRKARVTIEVFEESEPKGGINIYLKKDNLPKSLIGTTNNDGAKTIFLEPEEKSRYEFEITFNRRRYPERLMNAIDTTIRFSLTPVRIDTSRQRTRTSTMVTLNITTSPYPHKVTGFEGEDRSRGNGPGFIPNDLPPLSLDSNTESIELIVNQQRYRIALNLRRGNTFWLECKIDQRKAILSNDRGQRWPIIF